MGVGHVPAGPLPQARPGDDVPRREHRGAGAGPAAVARLGEDLAAGFLRRRGARVVARNVRVGRHEIDLLVRIDGERAAVEVKSGRAGPVDPIESFTAGKEARVRRAAAALGVHRVDLVTVVLGSDGVGIRWLPGV